MTSQRRLAFCLGASLLIIAGIPATVSAYFVYPSGYSYYHPGFYHSGYGYPGYYHPAYHHGFYHPYTGRYMVYPTTVTHSYWWHGGPAVHPYYHYGSHCHISGNALVCW